LKFAIYEDKTRPNDRLEEWVLYYDYHKDESTGQHIVSHMSLAEEVHMHGQKITISQAKRALGRFISDMAHVCTACLPDLPPIVRVIVELNLNEDAPTDYCPPGLVRYVAESTRFADTEDWECRTRSVTKMSSGHHKVELQVNYLALRHDEISNIVPSGLPCTKEVVDAAENEADPATATGSRQLTKASSTAKAPLRDTVTGLARHSADMQVKDRFARMVSVSYVQQGPKLTMNTASSAYEEHRYPGYPNSRR
jgi:hypothetical protein